MINCYQCWHFSLRSGMVNMYSERSKHAVQSFKNHHHRILILAPHYFSVLLFDIWYTLPELTLIKRLRWLAVRIRSHTVGYFIHVPAWINCYSYCQTKTKPTYGTFRYSSRKGWILNKMQLSRTQVITNVL